MVVEVEASLVKGSIYAQPSKSAMQRAVACALMAKGRSEILNPSLCDDALAAMKMAECLGADVNLLSDKVLIEGGYHPVCKKIFCGESGLGARVFSVLASLNHDWIEVYGSGSLLNRPVNNLSETLTEMGVEVISTNGFLPIKVRGPLKGGLAFLDGSVSSQFLTGLLIALPILDTDSRIIVNSLKSKPYIDLTINILNHFDIDIVNEDYKVFNIPGSQEYMAASYTVEGDWSGAAFLLVLGAIAGEIKLSGLSYMSAQADRAIIDILRDAGAVVEITGNEIMVKKSSLKSFKADISDSPDLAPPLAVLASFCEGRTIISGTDRLKVKESSRGEVLAEELSKLGVKILNHNDRIEIDGPSSIKSGKVDSHGDHRICMALSVLAAATENRVIISGAESVNKSYPGFFRDLSRIGVKINM